MRASRLLKLLMVLQARDKMNATELALHCETSIRTVYRDIESLSAMGIPVYSERGVEGGYRLLHGYRTRLNGLSAKEAETLFLAGLSDQAETMGLASSLADAQVKLMSALPEALRHDAERMQNRFLLDAPNWFSGNEQVEYLPDLMTAAREQCCVDITYQRWQGIRQRRVLPLGIVLKGGQWYLVAMVGPDTRTYRVARILSLALTEETFERPENFSLTEFWQTNLQRMASLQYPLLADVRLTPQGIKLMEQVCTPYVMTHADIDPVAVDGWYSARLPIGNPPYGCYDLLRFGPEIEVIGPTEVRQVMLKLTTSMAQQYSS
ncbi:helix-turn-helix transcriptional regulator [Marinomonas ostreistagni]|uniref:YafY family transcriptional regulator n=1 Tax=Marinomonas ostreistagni TaxID=359209 RepID=A0ABS0ZEK7_9GAMM|nr:YafY family protein [Marinomonas ostreistagni]MBJ7552109.1 YafY family transcriptional regulator [Marinomonas ostreistagni]